MATSLGTYLHTYVINMSDSLMHMIIAQLTRVKYDHKDFTCEYTVTPDHLVITITPQTTHAKFALQHITDTEIAEDLAKKETS